MTQPAVVASPDEVEDYRAKQAAEYGRYVATSNIYHGGALAYAAGQPVPASNVEQYRYDVSGLVVEVVAPKPSPSVNVPTTHAVDLTKDKD